ncbi:MAG: hypothetical protein COW24_02410 [Candidatus Kerfeldbacteria bacterium CG15_BIG_FIL_POST_REV_8_21_14_020_45_12]|uniref:HD domain-containing protein n=1 Tax=Candidatus Kerfeldbacteria bacterium CG15_BIG_FIL_POST_REV_8_21_14_020_45_12 TaxID=2014247 RepID=A0A2M7H445_9BACT|nr:MAG: hypothetical protein COW24_02410 [Candidatus Kerfeldbacteria bacterium CG15_BIG_FIL_POST_REV_8_21_14_020_45_12]PJA92866.1 MAG: hypothetical protein CO132_05715 [Candidatus Kerfeldbacteria bacterium CG_4_9_14_3_um_filter_45_8]
MKLPLPSYVTQALKILTDAGFEAFVVGGSVRDILLDREPKDYDLTTNASPDQIQNVFSDTLYNNDFGTVGVRLYEQDVRYELEITPYRSEAGYSDGRHPDAVSFGVSLHDDLQRRDFTINAMAYDGKQLIDPFGGQADCSAKIIRTVGDANERFTEDALRLLRAARFAAQLDFKVEPATLAAIKELAPTINKVSWERVRDELIKLISSDNSFRGIWLMHDTGLLQQVIPELEEGAGVGQNKHHIYSVFMHNLQAMQYCPSDDPLVRLAALLHDVGKPRVKEGDGKDSSFHSHEHTGAEMTRKIMQRLKFSKKDSERVEHLVRQHMFYYSQDEVSDAGIRRLLKRIGRENLDDLMAIRVGDRMGSGCQKEKPFKLIELERRIRAVEKDPMDTTMLKIDGNFIMELTGLTPGREVGVILNGLLNDVLEDPSLNTVEYLSGRATVLSKEAGYIK